MCTSLQKVSDATVCREPSPCPLQTGCTSWRAGLAQVPPWVPSRPFLSLYPDASPEAPALGWRATTSISFPKPVVPMAF